MKPPIHTWPEPVAPASANPIGRARRPWRAAAVRSTRAPSVARISRENFSPPPEGPLPLFPGRLLPEDFFESPGWGIILSFGIRDNGTESEFRACPTVANQSLPLHCPGQSSQTVPTHAVPQGPIRVHSQVGRARRPWRAAQDPATRLLSSAHGKTRLNSQLPGTLWKLPERVLLRSLAHSLFIILCP